MLEFPGLRNVGISRFAQSWKLQVCSMLEFEVCSKLEIPGLLKVGVPGLCKVERPDLSKCALPCFGKGGNRYQVCSNVALLTATAPWRSLRH
jgi:hypothetical protein